MTSYLRNASRTPFAAALALLAMMSGIRAVFDPDSLPLREVIGNLGYAWAVVYFSGGALMLLGMSTLRSKYEASGCILFAGGAAVQAVITLFFLGASVYLTGWSVAALVIFALAGVVRALHLMRGDTLIWLGVKR